MSEAAGDFSLRLCQRYPRLPTIEPDTKLSLSDFKGSITVVHLYTS